MYQDSTHREKNGRAGAAGPSSDNPIDVFPPLPLELTGGARTNTTSGRPLHPPRAGRASRLQGRPQRLRQHPVVVARRGLLPVEGYRLQQPNRPRRRAPNPEPKLFIPFHWDHGR
jgi:hypothetical protein